MNNTLPSQDITPNYEGMNSNMYMANDNQMYMPAAMPNIAGNNAAAYPEIYYKLQPHIMMVCDQMDAYGLLPTKEMMDNTSENIHGEVLKMHPEMAEYDKTKDKNAPDEMPEARQAVISDYGYGYGPGPGAGYGRGYGYGGGFRGRGALRDIIDILLLSEFHRRRRRYFW